MTKILLRIFFLICATIIYGQQACPTLKDKVGNENDITIDCGYLSSNNCFDLFGQFPEINNSINYEVKSTAYAFKEPATGAKKVSTYKNDQFVKAISFSDKALFGETPFGFHFYGKAYSGFVISSNGLITFNPQILESVYSTADFRGHTLAASDQYMPKLSVLGAYQDLDFSFKNGAEIYYEVEGTAPCRTVRVTFYKGLIHGAPQLSATSQIVLEEITGKIKIYIKDRPAVPSSALLSDAVVGVTNNVGNGLAAPSRDSGNWQAQNEGWEFAPGGGKITPTYKWYKDNTLIDGTTNNLTVCPADKSQTYKISASYPLIDSQFTISKEIRVNYADTYPLTKDYTEYFCNASAGSSLQSDFYDKISVNPVDNFYFKFYSSKSEAQSGGTPLDASQPLARDSSYYIRLESKGDSGCFRIAKLTLNQSAVPHFTEKVSICDSNNDGIERSFQLNRLSCQITVDGAPYTGKYFLNSTGEATETTDITAATEFYIELETMCGKRRLGPIKINFDAAPQVNTFTTPKDFNLCDVVDDTNGAYSEPYDWYKNFNDKVSNDPQASAPVFFDTYEKAYSNTPGENLNFIREGDPQKGYIYNIYARVEYKNGSACKGNCFSIATIPVRVQFSKIILNVKDADADFPADDPALYDTENADVYYCKDGSRAVNLADDATALIKPTNPLNGVGLKVTYHTSPESSRDLTSVGTSPNQTIEAGVSSKTFYIRYSLGGNCYVVKPLVYHYMEYHPLDVLNICVNNLDVPQTVTLRDYELNILGEAASENPRPTVAFYRHSDVTDVLTNLTLGRNPEKIFVKITSGYNTNCFQIFPLTVVPYERPDVKDAQIDLDCDNNNDGFEVVNIKDYESQLVTKNLEKLTFEYFLKYNNGSYEQPLNENDLKQYKVTGEHIIYVRISERGTACTGNANLTLKLTNKNKPVKLNDNATLLKCKTSGQTLTYVLNDAVAKLYSKDNPAFSGFIKTVHFYENMADLEANRNALPAAGYTIPLTEGRKMIYAKFTSVDGCYSIKPLILSIVDDLDYREKDVLIGLCNARFDGQYSFDIRAWLDEKLRQQDPLTIFLTDLDATNGANYRIFRKRLDNTSLTDAEMQNFKPDPVNQKSFWVKAEADNCEAWTEVKFDFGEKPLEFSYPNFCANETLNLKSFESGITNAVSFEYYQTKEDLINSTNPITVADQYKYDGHNEIFARVNLAQGMCAREMMIRIPSPYPLPELSHNQINGGQPLTFCPNGGSVDVRPNFSTLLPGISVAAYEWKSPAGNVISNSSYITGVKTEGKFTLTLTTAQGCKAISTFDVVAREIPTITKLTHINNDFKVDVQSTKPLYYAVSYAVNGQEKMSEWQSSNEFKNLPEGIITFYVKYQEEAGQSACYNTKQTLIPVIHNVVTPNGDGANDSWTVKDLSIFQGEKTVLKIFDRYGKSIYENESSQELNWDGTSNRRIVGTGTYWYLIQLPDGNVYNGYILLKNRN